MSFSLRLKGLREDLELSQAELAKELGVGIGSIGMWESTDRIPPSKKLIKIAEYFNCTTDYLLGHSDNKYPVSSSLSADEQKLLNNYRATRLDLRPSLITMSETLAKTPDEIAGNTQKKKA